MEVTLEDVNRIAGALKEFSHYDLTEYSEKSLKRRIQKIIDDYKMNPSSIIHKIKNNKDFAKKLVNDITVNTTEFFRDPPVVLFEI